MMDFKERANEEFQRLLDKGQIEEERLSDTERRDLMELAEAMARDRMTRGVDHL